MFKLLNSGYQWLCCAVLCFIALCCDLCDARPPAYHSQLPTSRSERVLVQEMQLNPFATQQLVAQLP
jgi:hypothetical protein